MVLSSLFNWRFVRINEAFESMKEVSWVKEGSQAVERPLYVYVNLVKSQWLEATYDQLLRTVPYKSGDVRWVSRHVQYHRLHRSRIETVHVRVTEVDGHFHRRNEP